MSNQATARDLRGGFSTLMGSICIAALVPAMLNQAGASAVTSVAATALACTLGTALFASITRLPFAIGPGIVPASLMASHLAAGIPLGTVLGIELIAGLLFGLLVMLGLVGRCVRRMPPVLKTAGEIAIGLYLLFAALRAAGVMHGDADGPALGAGAWAFLAGLAVTFFLSRMPRWQGYATLAGVLVAAGGSALAGLTPMPEQAWSLPSLEWHAPDLMAALDWHYAAEVLVLLYVVAVDVVATLETLARCEPELQGADGSLRGFDRALKASAGVFILSPFLGTAPMLVFFESLGGVLAGARTARAAAVVAAGFALLMVCSPLAGAIPPGACAVALAFVGFSIAHHALHQLPGAEAGAGAVRLGQHLAIAALVLVVAAQYLAVALFALFALYPVLAHSTAQRPRAGEVVAAVAACGLLITMLA